MHKRSGHSLNVNTLEIQIPKYPARYEENQKEFNVDKWIDRYAMGEVFEKDEFKRIVGIVKANNLWQKFEMAAFTHTQFKSSFQISTPSKAIESAPRSRSSSRERRSSRSWSLSSMDEVLSNLALPQFTTAGTGITGHHKIARSKLRKLLKCLTETQKRSLMKVIEPMVSDAPPISVGSSDSEAGNLTKENADWLERAIQSLNFNVFPGPPPDQRIDDEGAALDCHYFADGSLTPRSNALSKIERLITFAVHSDLTLHKKKNHSSKAFENKFTDIQFDELLAALTEAHEAHQAIVEAIVIDTDIAHWLELPRNGTTSFWVRKPADPHHYPEIKNRKGSAYWLSRNKHE